MATNEIDANTAPGGGGEGNGTKKAFVLSATATPFASTGAPSLCAEDSKMGPLVGATSTGFPEEVETWARMRVIVLIDADQFFQAKHMQRCAQLPTNFELHFFSCAVYPSGVRKRGLAHVSGFCDQAAAVGRRAFHETTQDPTADAADRLMVSKARELHVAESADVPFVYVSNDRQLALQLARALSERIAVHWNNLHLPREPSAATTRRLDVDG